MAASVVLVHGAWHGPWCWDKVADLLGGKGVGARAVDLPGPGGCPGDLTADAAAVRRALDAAGEGTVLCGHSYGGAVVTEAGTHPSVAHLVYVTAFAPDTGTCVRDLLAPGEGRWIPATLEEDGLIRLRREALDVLYHDCDPSDVEVARARLRPQHPEGFSTPITAAAWRSVPSTYAVCCEDRAIDPALQRVMATRIGADVVEWHTGHFPMLCRPEAVAGLLARLARL